MVRWSRPLVPGVAIALEIALAALVTAGPVVAAKRPAARDKCPVCGMFVAHFPEWTAQLVLEDDTARFFDGAKDLFKFLLSSDRAERGDDSAPIAAIFVTTYDEREVIDARSAFFVVGSDVLGPMGAELVAHTSSDEAEEFARDHGGIAVVVFDLVDLDLIARLDSRPGGGR
jgi:nitrous oxide reductase accessory protein NosL